MPPVVFPSGWQRAFAILGTFALVIGALWWAQHFFIILALAILIAFALQPLVTTVEGLGLKRAAAVLICAAGAFCVLGGLGWLFAMQLTDMSHNWPTYRGQIEEKINQLDPWREQKFLLTHLTDLVQNLAQGFLASVIAPALEVLLTAVFIVILVIFMLLRREDLRNRMIRLFGHERRTVTTTKALDEAAQRISRYLLMQVIINASFGLVLGICLFLFGLPYAALWGVLAALMRFIPYVGTWVGLVMPAFFSLATSQRWLQVVEVVGVFIVLEVITANVLEPLLFGMSAGVSPIALLVSAIFWAWLWGPIGLILSTPMTVCLLVLGRYVPELEVFQILLGEEPALEASINYYQRLLARDQDEATDIVEQYMQNHTLEQLLDEVLIPALVTAKRDHEQGELADEDKDFVLNVTRELVADLGYFESLVAKPIPAPAAVVAAPATRVRILGCPAVDEFDELALLMIRQLVEAAGVMVDTVSAKVLSSEILGVIEKQEPALVFIATLPPSGLSQTRYLCKRLRARFPDLQILVGRWGTKENDEQTRERLLAAGASQVGMTIAASRGQVVPLAQSLAHVVETPAAAPEKVAVAPAS